MTSSLRQLCQLFASLEASRASAAAAWAHLITQLAQSAESPLPFCSSSIFRKVPLSLPWQLCPLASEGGLDQLPASGNRHPVEDEGGFTVCLNPG
jgi:hypothetical protein